ncbi:VPS27 [Cucurbita argyrosperma subsp. argyrosperma]|nr:VPS27 [Cucurbita argyrosperma subsp. argyrosperma]
MLAEPPPFQEAARCEVCKCSFNTFRRRHHCRCCGRTLCHEHSSFQMALPQFDIHSSVRVCADCFNNSSQSREVDRPPSLAVVDQVADTVSQLNFDGNVNSEPKSAVEHQPGVEHFRCNCGMPLCILCRSSPVYENRICSLQKKQFPPLLGTIQKQSRLDSNPKE